MIILTTRSDKKNDSYDEETDNLNQSRPVTKVYHSTRHIFIIL